MYPVSGEGLRGTTLIGIERRKAARVIEKVEVQTKIGAAVTGVEVVRRGGVPIDADAPLSGGLNFGDAGTLEDVFLHGTAINAVCAGSKWNIGDTSAGRRCDQSRKRIQEQLHVRIGQQAFQGADASGRRNIQRLPLCGLVLTIVLKSPVEE